MHVVRRALASRDSTEQGFVYRWFSQCRVESTRGRSVRSTAEHCSLGAARVEGAASYRQQEAGFLNRTTFPRTIQRLDGDDPHPRTSTRTILRCESRHRNECVPHATAVQSIIFLRRTPTAEIRRKRESVTTLLRARHTRVARVVPRRRVQQQNNEHFSEQRTERG